MKAILRLYMREQPRQFYLDALAAGGVIASIVLIIPIIFELSANRPRAAPATDWRCSPPW